MYMKSNLPLAGEHLRTYNTIFQHPISHNLGWKEVHALFRHVAEVEESPNGKLKVTRHGVTLTLDAARTKDVGDNAQLMALRHFLERSEAAPAGVGCSLLVIDHRQARFFRSTTNEGAPELFLPHPPEDGFRQAPNAKDFSRGQEKPDVNSFFEPIAQALKSADRILVFGTGTGTSSEMAQFIAWLGIHHVDVAKRMIGSHTVDEHHLTDGQLLAKARAFHAAAQPSEAPSPSTR
jgi:hypothetical protein